MKTSSRRIKNKNTRNNTFSDRINYWVIFTSWKGIRREEIMCNFGKRYHFSTSKMLYEFSSIFPLNKFRQQILFLNVSTNIDMKWHLYICVCVSVYSLFSCTLIYVLYVAIYLLHRRIIYIEHVYRGNIYSVFSCVEKIYSLFGCRKIYKSIPSFSQSHIMLANVSPPHPWHKHLLK